MKAWLMILGCLLSWLLQGPAAAQSPPSGTWVRPASVPTGTLVVPDRFLRRWDALTLFFDRDLGRAGAPEDHPEQFVRLQPSHPGAFVWLDARTLQFRPADPWPPLSRFTWTAGERSGELLTLMEAPQQLIPSPGATGLTPIEAITLSFAEPLSAEALAQMVRIELRPLPGLGEEKVRTLGAEDFRVKVLERRTLADPASYVLELATPIPFGLEVSLGLRLSAAEDEGRFFAEYRFSTAAPFRVQRMGSGYNRYPVALAGSRYGRDQALNAGYSERLLTLEFSAQPAAVDAVAARSLVHLSPPVEKLDFQISGNTLEIRGDFKWDSLYQLLLTPGSGLKDTQGRPLEMAGESELYFYFPIRSPYLHWGKGQGVMERHGPQQLPVEGRGQERLDLRIHRIDPLDRSFWPFPDRFLTQDESQRPPGPGETPVPFTAVGTINQQQLLEQINALGTPLVSTLVDLPLTRQGGAASFGLDIAEHLARISGPDAPGHYLVGLRALGKGAERLWLRAQVTDLSLTTMEEPDAVRFYVTSLRTGAPIAGASIRVEGGQENAWVNLASGSTLADGSFTWRAPGLQSRGHQARVLRISVEKAGDVLVLDPSRSPEVFADNAWSSDSATWLQWAFEDLGYRVPRPEYLAHVFTERPVYRPEDKVYIKGYLRERHHGEFRLLALGKPALVVDGPGGLQWRYPLTINEAGSFFHVFQEKDIPTGEYNTHVEGVPPGGGSWRSPDQPFRVEAYRVPEFEVNLHVPDRVPLDKDFQVGLTATYYAGGRVAGRPVSWRVTQFPYAWQPKGREGFFFSSDSRFSRNARFEAKAAQQQAEVTDAEGTSSIRIDPTADPSAQPRSYFVEATLTGADDQTVSNTRRVLALPPFVLGLKLPRYLERAQELEPEILVLGHDERPLAGQAFKLRLLHRRWHSHLRVSDFSDGVARYVTETVDEKVQELNLVSTAEPMKLKLPIAEAGVYLVELESQDRLGRTQVMSLDLFAGGDQAVAWSKPSSKVFKVDTDKKLYNPGETATFVLESPFQNAEALVAVETPSGNRYSWLPVRGGTAVFELKVEPGWTPRLPVHFLLMRGRLPNTGPLPATALDLGKPATLGATTWIQVAPRANRIEVGLEHPERSLPGRVVEVAIRLQTPEGKPLPGEVTLWLVDQAVLSLGKEQRLDPLPDFITEVQSRLNARDTRAMPFGRLPFAEAPGGDGEAEPEEPLERETVRRNFQAVPFYDPNIKVGPDGLAKVKVKLPDNLTNFKLRAKAVSGADRFGYATGTLAVRLPIIVQAALPRFVRPGDRFLAAAIGRVVEGPGGPGTGGFEVEGLQLEGAARSEVDWTLNQPKRLEVPVRVAQPGYGQDGRPKGRQVLVRARVDRQADGAADAFEVKLPVRDDRRPQSERRLIELSPGEPVALPELSTQARPGTVRRSLLISDRPALVRMAAASSFLAEYPYGCNEQRLALARAHLALARFRKSLQLGGGDEATKRAVQSSLEAVKASLDPNGLVAYWPGGPGYVSLTAWTLELLAEAREAGLTPDDKLLSGLTRTLEQTLRSDYSHFIDGESRAERAAALRALARVGRFDEGYAAELVRAAEYLPLESKAQVLQAFTLGKSGAEVLRDRLAESLWQGVLTRLHQGREVYAGLKDVSRPRHGLILPSETRTLGEMIRALAPRGDKERLQRLVDALVNLGQGDGWGNTQANAAALLALSALVDPSIADTQPQAVQIEGSGAPERLGIGPQAPLATLQQTQGGPAKAMLVEGQGPLILRAELSWVPAEEGSQAPATMQGFVISRDILRQQAEGPPVRIALENPGTQVKLLVGDVVEEHVRLVNPEDRHFVAVVVPLAAAMEPLNPNLATAPAEARPKGQLSLAPTYAAYLDDQVAFYYDSLPKGSYDFYFRTRAATQGQFTQPGAYAELMYDGAVWGHSPGAKIEVGRRKE